MSVLTNKERDGLEDVFLSIHTNSEKYKKIKNLSSLLFAINFDFSAPKLLKQVKLGIKESKLSNLLTKYTKKKRNLRK